MNKQIVNFIIVVAVMSLNNCNTPNSITKITAEVSKTVVKNNHVTKIISSEENLWKSSISNIGTDEILENLTIINDKTAYLIGENENLYKTKDAGKTWELIKINIPNGGFISNISFYDLSYGYVSVVKNPENVLDVNNFQSWIYATKNEGQTWVKEFEVKGGEINKIVFDRDTNVWAIGRKLLKTENSVNQSLILLKSFKSGMWEEQEAPKRLVSLENLYIDYDSTKKFIDTEGRIFELNNLSKWNSAIGIDDVKPQQIRITDIEITKDKTTYLIGSTGGREGIWTSFFKKEHLTKQWKQFTFENVILRDTVVLSSNEIIACGSLSNSDDSKQTVTKKGVVVHSIDGGLSWTLLFASDSVGSFNGLWFVNEKKILVIGEKGKIFHLKKSL